MSGAEPGRLILVWYFHLPVVTPDEEVLDMVRESMAPLVAVHERTGRPVALAITGALLARLPKLVPALVDALKRAAAEGRLELLATFYHEVFPAFIPLRYLSRHIACDLELKRELFDVSAGTFVPGNYSWTPTLCPLLTGHGCRQVILDDRHCREAHRTQLWSWRNHSKAGWTRTELADTVLDPEECERPHRLDHGGGGPPLLCLFRSRRVVKELTFGTSGAIHRPFDDPAFDRVVAEMSHRLEAGTWLTLADDGDRVNPVSLPRYETLLERVPEDRFTTPAEAGRKPQSFPRIPYLPSFSPASLDDFWMSDLDSWYYLRLLDELYQSMRDEDDRWDRQVMELQDVYPFFWKTRDRKWFYFDRAGSLLLGPRPEE